MGEGRFELKAVIDGETRVKLERLKFLLSYKNPSMGYGELLGNLLDLGLKKHDPSLRGKKPSQKLSASEQSDRSASEQSDRSLGAKIKAPAQALRLRPQSGSAPGSGKNAGSALGSKGKPAGSALGLEENK